MVRSPVGKWNVWSSGLHLSTNEVTKAWSTFKCLSFAISPNPTCSKIGIVKGCGSAIEWQ